MKTRHLRKSIQILLESIAILSISFLAMVNDMAISFIPTYFLIAIVGASCGYLAIRYGKGQ